MAPITDEQKDRVLKALENPDYKWRTVDGVVKETGLPPDTVLEVLIQCTDQVVESRGRSTTGERLFTTRSHFRGHAGIATKFLGSFSNRLT